MKVRKLSPTGDFVFGNSLADFYADVPAAPGQVAQTSLQLVQGEWYLDTSAGTPYLGAILGKTTQSVADLTVQNTVLNAEGVTDISEYSSQIDPVTRAYSVEMKINTVYGPTDVEIENIQNF